MHIIMAAHGFLSKEMLNSAEMICGKQKNVDVIEFIPGENTEDLKQKYMECINKIQKSIETLIVVDLFGGSPFNAAFEIVMKNEKIDILTGMNIPMLLELFMMRNELDLEGIVKRINKNKTEYIKSCKQQLIILDEEDL